MSEEEIRMRCLELAASMMGDINNYDILCNTANNLRKYVIQDRYPNENKIEFEKINALRPMEN